VRPGDDFHRSNRSFRQTANKEVKGLVAPDRSLLPRIRALGRRGHGSAIVVTLGGRIAPADVPALWERVRDLLAGSEADLVLCDVAALVAPDAVTVDALARLQLTARRSRCRLRLRYPCGELQDLLALMGLSDVLGPALPVKPGGEIEQREPPLRVQEERDTGDPIV
jgi:ABC-type transporter Mla MlaB component